MICLHYTSAMSQPFLLLIATNLALAGFWGWKLCLWATAILMLIAANLAQAGFLDWKWSLWHVPDWLAVQRIKAVFFLTLYDSINDMKHFWTFCITPQPWHSHFCCWLLPIWPKLDVWAENGACGMCRLGWRYIIEKLYFSWPYKLV